MEYLLGGQNDMNSLDFYIQNYFSLHRTSGLTEFMYIVSAFFDITIYSILVFLCFASLAYFVKGNGGFAFFVSTVLFTTVSVYFLKIFFNIARPLGGAVYAFGASFPSYHAAMSTVFFIMIFYIFDPLVYSGPFKELKLWIRRIELAFIFIMVFAVSYSRIYLGVHWFTDVAFGIIWGVIVFYISRFLFKKFNWL